MCVNAWRRACISDGRNGACSRTLCVPDGGRIVVDRVDILALANLSVKIADRTIFGDHGYVTTEAPYPRPSGRPLALAANLSLLFTELPFLARPAAARAAGFDRVEMWWPFTEAIAPSGAIDALVDALAAAGVDLVGLNFFAGDMPGGERGVASDPARRAELEANCADVLRIGRETGCRHFNLLYGQRLERYSAAEQDAAAISAIDWVARAVAVIGGTVLIEPLAKGLNGTYPLTDPDHVVDLLQGPLVEHPNVKLLFDTFHLGSNGVDIVTAAGKYAPWIGHVQLADAPGRGEPGSGHLPIGATLERLVNAGYRGTVAAEYKPTASTEQTLGWVEALARAGLVAWR